MYQSQTDVSDVAHHHQSPLLTIINLQGDFHLFFALDAVRTLSQHLVTLLVPLPQLTELNADPRVIRAWGLSLLGGCAGAESGHDAAEG